MYTTANHEVILQLAKTKEKKPSRDQFISNKHPRSFRSVQYRPNEVLKAVLRGGWTSSVWMVERNWAGETVFSFHTNAVCFSIRILTKLENEAFTKPGGNVKRKVVVFEQTMF